MLLQVMPHALEALKYQQQLSQKLNCRWSVALAGTKAAAATSAAVHAGAGGQAEQQ
jgi:hypothetical protein